MFVHQGIVAVAWVQAVIAIVARVVTLGIVCRMLGVRALDVGVAIGPPLLASAVMSAVLLAIRGALSEPWLIVIAGGVAGAVVYFGLLHLLARDMLPALRDMAFPRRAPESAAVSSAWPRPNASRRRPDARVQRRAVDRRRGRRRPGSDRSDLEVVVVDEGTARPAAAELESVRDERLRILRSVANRGVSAARNSALAAARAPVVAQLDADDLWKETHLEGVLGELDDPSVGLACPTPRSSVILGERGCGSRRATRVSWRFGSGREPSRQRPRHAVRGNPIPAPAVVMHSHAGARGRGLSGVAER